MNGSKRPVGLALILLTGACLVLLLASEHIETSLESSLEPVFELIGIPVKALNHFVTRVLPVDGVDEGEFGDVLRARYDAGADTADQDFEYLNALMERLAVHGEKPFEYRVYIMHTGIPNAMALPGGVIFVTSGLLDVLHSEAELAAVLGHEMGHIERGHSLDAVRFRLLADKFGARPLGNIVDAGVHVLLTHSFSKTQEDDADEYAYAVLLKTRYDPRAVGLAFRSLREYVADWRPTRSGANPFRDYFSSHPPLEIREDRFTERAEAWWWRHARETRVLGEENLGRRSLVR